jgi:hypothetical protein
MEAQNIITHNGETVTFEVSPCSWMYKHYGLQVRVSLEGDNCNAVSEFLLDKGYEATAMTKDEMATSAKAMVEDWLAKNGTDPLHSRLESWKKAKAAFEADIEKTNKRHATASARRDKRYKAKGFTHRVNAIIHGEGDDYETVAYFAGTPNDAQIAKLLRESAVKNDYVVTEL